MKPNRLFLVAALALLAAPAMAQQQADPVIQTFAGSAQMMIQRYAEAVQQSQKDKADLAAANVKLACWEKTGKACPAPVQPKQPAPPVPPPVKK